MNIFVVTPVYQSNPGWLNKCIDSVNAQTAGPVTQILVCDGDQAFAKPPSFPGKFVRLRRRRKDYGDTPRSKGIQKAIIEGADAIALLDDDNWFEADHIERAIECHRKTGAGVVASRRTMVDWDGNPIGVCRDCGTSKMFADTSSIVYFPEAFSHLRIWERMPAWQHPIGDRVMLHTLREAGLQIGLTDAPTLNYRCTHAMLYQKYNRAVPKDAKTDDLVQDAVDRWEALTGHPIHLSYALED